jgi:hypothetical protein
METTVAQRLVAQTKLLCRRWDRLPVRYPLDGKFLDVRPYAYFGTFFISCLSNAMLILRQLWATKFRGKLDLRKVHSSTPFKFVNCDAFDAAADQNRYAEVKPTVSGRTV